MAEEVESGCESQDADEKTVQPEDPEQPRPPPPRRSPRSVLRVSQLLLRAISGHRPLTLTDLKKELGSAGYEVRRKIARRSGTPARPEATGTLLRVSGRDASGYFRVWKIPKSKRKSRRSRARETSCCGRGCPLRSAPPRPLRPRSRRKAAKKARECWRRKVRPLNAQSRRVRVRSRAKDRQTRARARKEARAQVMDRDRASLSSEDTCSSSCDQRRPSSKFRDESAVLAKRTTQRPTSVRADRAPCGPAKMRTRCSAAPDGPGNSSRNL